MLISVGDARLFVDVVGATLTEADGVTIERPVVLFLHGGPGFDHMSLRPHYEALADVAQLIFFDHRGNGRSDRSDSKHWNLAQWSADVAALIDALGLQRPIIFGQSFGGIVAHVIFRNCGHGPARDRPQETLACLRQFITRVTHASQSGAGGPPRGQKRTAAST